MISNSSLLTVRPRQRFLSRSLVLAVVIALSAVIGGSAQAAPAVAPSAGTWKLLPAAPATAKPFQVVSVWTGHQMIIHGIFGPAQGRFTLAYRPAARTWAKLAAGPAWVSVESDDIAVWTGSRMLVIGLTNGSYDPAAGHWTPVRGPGGPTSGAFGWTGHQLLLWLGSCCGGGSDAVQAYNPGANTWSKPSVSPLEMRAAASGTWTGKELVVAGGITTVPSHPDRTLRDGAAYNPVTRKWRKIAPMPIDHWGATAVWDGKEVLFIGGIAGAPGTGVQLATRGLAYDPAANRWRWLPKMEFPRSGFVAVWTGRQVLVWGGLTAAKIPPPHGAAFTPATGKWTALPVSPLRGRVSATAVWTGSQMIIWGGYLPSSAGVTTFTNGAAYTPGR